jgi:hypothetical protein
MGVATWSLASSTSQPTGLGFDFTGLDATGATVFHGLLQPDPNNGGYDVVVDFPTAETILVGTDGTITPPDPNSLTTEDWLFAGGVDDLWDWDGDDFELGALGAAHESFPRAVARRGRRTACSSRASKVRAVPPHATLDQSSAINPLLRP